MNSIRFDWYQNKNLIIIDIFVKNLKPEDVAIKFSEKTIQVTINNDSVQYEKKFELSGSIDAEKSKFSIGKVKLEILLTKLDTGKLWKNLEIGEETEETLKYPSSAKNPVDSSKIQINETEMEPTGEAAINALFQKIYADANDETRRAMMKSFIESKGTVLSTNWSEVGEKEIKPIPPKNN